MNEEHTPTWDTKPEDVETTNLFHRLPVEIKLRIFGYFKPAELRRVIAPVCKEWWLVSKDPTLWTELSFDKEITSEKQTASCCEIISRRKILRSLKICCEEKYFYTIIQCSTFFPRLTKIEVCLSRFENHSFISVALQTVVINCPLLKSVTLNVTKLEYCDAVHILSLVNLRQLSLPQCTSIENMSVESISRHCTKLEYLNISQLVGVTDKDVRVLSQLHSETLTHLFLSIESLKDEGFLFISCCRGLSTLEITSGRLITNRSMKSLSSIDNLRSLKIEGCSRLTSRAFKRCFMKPNVALLEELYLSNIRIDDLGLQALAGNCKSLRELHLDSCCEVTDVGLKAVIENCKLLRKLILKHLSRLFGEVLLPISSKLPNLTYLEVVECHNLVRHLNLKHFVNQMPSLKVVLLNNYDDEDDYSDVYIPGFDEDDYSDVYIPGSDEEEYYGRWADRPFYFRY